jgi:hypothetical protein
VIAKPALMDKDFVILLVGALLIALVAIGAFIGSIWLGAVKARTMLRTWAAEGGFQIVRFEKKNWTNRGPFGWWTNSPYQMIYRIRVRDRRGRERLAWVRCGSYRGGILFSNRIEARWEE